MRAVPYCEMDGRFQVGSKRSGGTDKEEVAVVDMDTKTSDDCLCAA